MIDTNGMRRAAAGGETGVNGEFYEGGKFMPSREDRPKTAPVVREVRPEDVARREREAAKAVVVKAWLEGRVHRFKDLLACLEAVPTDQWGNELPGARNAFHADLAATLRATGSLSPRQALYACKAMFSRRTKASAALFDELHHDLTETFNASVEAL